MIEDKKLKHCNKPNRMNDVEIMEILILFHSGGFPCFKHYYKEYDFCKLVDSQIQDDNVTAEALFQFVEALEQDNHEMQIVKDLQEVVDDIQFRTLFYEVCFDFFSQDGDGRSSLNRTLSAMYEVFGLQFWERRLLLGGFHPLIKADLVEISGDNEDIIFFKGAYFEDVN